MIAISKRAIGAAVIALAATCSTASANSPIGIWYDHTGRGAVEITDCGGKLCGSLVWLKEAGHKEGCGFQIIGNVKPISAGKWDNGWIIDPEKDPNTKYDVEITLQGDKLKVMGYAGMKFLSQTMIWTRAPADLKRCSDTTARAPETAPTPAAPPKRADGEPPTVYPPPAAETPAPTPPPATNPDPPRTAERDKPATAAKGNCKVEFGGITLTFPCPD